MPVYNSAGYLKKSMESLLQQTYSNFEIILVDDCSTDDSYAIAKSFEGERIKILQQKNAGAAVARNTGLSAAKGDYIQFMDADDFLSPDKIEKQIHAIKQFPNHVAVCNYISFVNDEELANATSTDQSSFIFTSHDPVNFLLNLWGANGESEFIQTNCWLVPRHLIEKTGGWRNYRCPDDDGEFFTRIVLASRGIVYVPGITNYYRREITKNKLSANPQKKYVQNTLLTIDLKYSYIKNKGQTELVNKTFAKQYLDFGVERYPQYKTLSAIALRRFQQMNQRAKLPLLGGKMIELIKNIFGWRLARLIKHYL
jgi:glycosyltransferase involved in cell wall biosynthesis